MKLPSRLLGLLLATAAAPIVAGCTADTTDTQGKSEQAQTQAPGTTEQVGTPKSAAPAQPEQKEEQTEEETEQAQPAATPGTPSNDPCPGCGMG